MFVVKDQVTLAFAMVAPIADTIKLLLRTRADLIDLANFIVVDQSDALIDIETAAGIPIATNLVDGSHYGTPDYVPSFEWALDHGGLFELTYVLGDDGSGVVLIVPDSEGIDPVLLAIAREFAEPADENNVDQFQDGEPMLP